MVDALLGPREPNPVRDGSCAGPSGDDVIAQASRSLRVHTVDVAARVLDVDNGNLYATDLSVTTMLQRRRRDSVADLR